MTTTALASLLGLQKKVAVPALDNGNTLTELAQTCVVYCGNRNLRQVDQCRADLSGVDWGKPIDRLRRQSLKTSKVYIIRTVGILRWAEKVGELLNGRWLKRALGAAQIRDRSSIAFVDEKFVGFEQRIEQLTTGAQNPVPRGRGKDRGDER